ncbi:MAG TPA: hypothetical protein VMV10_05095 [Pirellulales bacterium]|nr:hypothetical protein [Pirellulales bacterium]
MKWNRRYLTYSLRTFFILLTGFAIWLGWKVNRAREQREAMKAIEAMGGSAFYDWQVEAFSPGFGVLQEPRSPILAWLRRLGCGDIFYDAEQVAIGINSRDRIVRASEIRNWIPALQRLPKLKTVSIAASISEKARSELEAALPPNCTLFAMPPPPPAPPP